MIHQTHTPTVDHTFVYHTPNSVQMVNLAGTFNGWDKDKNRMKGSVDGRTWTTTLPLAYGKVQYKFVVNGSQWLVDPMVKTVSDGNGNENSEIMVLPPDYANPASPSDGVTAKSVLFHDPRLNYDRGNLQFAFRARPDDLSEIDLLANGKRIKMEVSGQDELFQYYRAELPWDRHLNVSYRFELHDGSKVGFFGATGFSDEPGSPFKLVADNFRPFEVPDWVNHSVLYQIFPDRFADGDPTNDPPGVRPPDAKPTYSNRFGGDTAGVLQHLNYLKELGIRGIYFTPVFASPSNHRYDATDYLKIDSQFGTNQEFDEMTKTLQRNGIRTVMDFAFNHSATDFFAFSDILRNQATSKFLPWYFIHSFPVAEKENPSYEAFGGHGSMPKLNTVNPETEKYLLAVADYWIRHAALSGLRLDDATEVDSKFWQDLRIMVKREKKDTWIVGEDWGDASPWLHGDQWDSVMGYQFRDACLDFFVDRKLSPSGFLGRLLTVYGSYPPQVSRTLMNLIGTHDTPRFLTLCHGDENLLKLAAMVQLTWPGTPCIYYGDEIGMTGGADPDDRRMMDWPSATRSNGVLSYYKKVIDARNHCPALQSGEPEILGKDDSQRTFSYARTLGSDAAIVVVNASNSAKTVSFTLPNTQSFHSLRVNAYDVLTGRRYESAGVISVPLPPLGAALLLPKENLDSLLLQGVFRAEGQVTSGHRSPISSQGAL